MEEAPETIHAIQIASHWFAVERITAPGKRPSRDYTRTDLVEAQIQSAVMAERQRIIRNIHWHADNDELFGRVDSVISHIERPRK